jgi:hypothetical protein
MVDRRSGEKVAAGGIRHRVAGAIPDQRGFRLSSTTGDREKDEWGHE